MMRVLIGILLVLSLAIPAAAVNITPPEVPQAGLARMPQKTDSFGDGLAELMDNSIKQIQPELKNAVQISSGILFAAILFSLLEIWTDGTHLSISIAGAVTIAAIMLQNTDAMIDYTAEMVWEICEYGKLLCPVLTTALAAQGGITAATALYTGTSAFIALLSTLVSRLMVPMVYIYLAFSVTQCGMGGQIMKRFSDALRSFLSWLLKTLLIVFTTYMSVTGVVSGTTDAAARKAAKVAISSVVPVVGGILSDASESVLVSIGVMKNAAGIYGILAVLAVFVGPFMKVGSQYLILKGTAAVCSLFSSKNISELVENFSVAMGLLLAMVAVGCTLVLISTVCFMKGIG